MFSYKIIAALCLLFTPATKSKSADFYKIPPESKYTIIIPKKSQFCLYHPIFSGLDKLKLQYEVIYAKFDLDIDLLMADPSGKQIAAVRRRKSRKMDLDTTIMGEGNLEICFSNHYSGTSEKKVYVSVQSEFSKSYLRRQRWKEKEEKEQLEKELKLNGTDTEKEAFTREEHKKYLELTSIIEKYIKKSTKTISYLGASKNQDTAVLNGCIKRMDFWISLNLVIMLATVVKQVMTIKKQFAYRILRENRRRSGA